MANRNGFKFKQLINHVKKYTQVKVCICMNYLKVQVTVS